MVSTADGWLNLLKPMGMSSQQAVTKAKRLIGEKKAGHAGTLDPLATGVLPIAFGAATKTIPYLVEHHKTYAFTVTFGESRTTDDLEGEVLDRGGVIPTLDEIQLILPQFIGKISQIPPIFSAIKINGKRAYALARRGEDVVLAPRNVEITSLVLKELEGAEGRFLVHCGKGTYVRSLARDIAKACGSFGFVSSLHRCAVGKFRECDAISLAMLEEMSHNAKAKNLLLPLEAVLDDIPVQHLTQQQVCEIRQGKSIPSLLHPSDTALAQYEHQPVALGRVSGSNFLPFRVFPEKLNVVN